MYALVGYKAPGKDDLRHRLLSPASCTKLVAIRPVIDNVRPLKIVRIRGSRFVPEKLAAKDNRHVLQSLGNASCCEDAGVNCAYAAPDG